MSGRFVDKMKRALLRILRCPGCMGKLSLETFESGPGREIMEGTLSCRGCGRWYPVINGIPRMLPISMINGELVRAFLARHSGRLPGKSKERAAPGARSLKERTAESFGFQWNVFSEMIRDYRPNFLNYIKPLKPSFFKGKLVLDAGCGFGRHTYYAAAFGAEVVGFDLSDAVEAAYRNCRKFGRVHIVQGDIYSLPFAKRFDFIMSIGVLHHLPDPKAGFMRLVGLMGKGTGIFAWLYGREGRWFKIHVVEGIIRKVTTRMPHRMLYYSCYIPAAIYHMSNKLYNLLSRHRVTAGLSAHLPFKGYARFPFIVKHADAFDLLATPVNNYYTKHEVEQWARDAGLRDVSITSIEGKSWRLFGKK